MKETNDFNGIINLRPGMTVRFCSGYDKLQVKEYTHRQCYNTFFWCKREKMLLYRDRGGDFYKMNFEKIEL